MKFKETKKWFMFSEYTLAGYGYTLAQDYRVGSELVLCPEDRKKKCWEPRSESSRQDRRCYYGCKMGEEGTGGGDGEHRILLGWSHRTCCVGLSYFSAGLCLLSVLARSWGAAIFSSCCMVLGYVGVPGVISPECCKLNVGLSFNEKAGAKAL